MGAYPTTHIANGCNRPIWAMCDTDRQHTLFLNFNTPGIGAGINNNNAVHNAIRPGFTKIAPEKYLGFKPKIGIFGANWINRNTVYITIEYEDENDQRIKICEAFPKASNESVIVTSDYTIRATKMGYLWIDTAGNNHCPTENYYETRQYNQEVADRRSATLFTPNNIAFSVLAVYAILTTIHVIRLSPKWNKYGLNLSKKIFNNLFS